MFDKSVYIQRRKKLLEDIDSGIILLLGNDESPMNYTDNPFHFRQDSTFLYYFGLDYPGLAAVIDVDAGKEIMFGNELTIDDIVWMGNQPTLKDRSLSVGVDQTAPTNMLHDVLRFEDFINYEELEKYRDFGGLRNEEDFLITENGARLLGKYIPTTVEEIEEIKNQ